MSLIKLLFFCGLLGLGYSYNEVNSCYTKRTVCSGDSGYREDIKGIRESLQNISTTLKLIGELYNYYVMLRQLINIDSKPLPISQQVYFTGTFFLLFSTAQNLGTAGTESTPTDPDPDTTTTDLPTTTEPPPTTETPTTTEPPPPIGSVENPASSCSDIPQDSPSGEYWIQTSSNNSPVQVYCDMNPRNCSCNTTGGWTRVANLDMTDPSQQCPDGFRLVNRTTAPLRTCGRPDNFVGCMSTTFPVNGIEYSHVCGRVIGYQDRTTDGFIAYYANRALTIDDYYLDGISLTHGQSPRQHIWTFVAGQDEIVTDRTCPCTRSDLAYTGVVPPFIGQDYFCAIGSRDRYQLIFYPDDPLWDGQGCGGTSTCCSFNNPPWFCKQLPQSSTDDIELRLCSDSDIVDEDTPIEMVEIFIK